MNYCDWLREKTVYEERAHACEQALEQIDLQSEHSPVGECRNEYSHSELRSLDERRSSINFLKTIIFLLAASMISIPALAESIDSRALQVKQSFADKTFDMLGESFIEGEIEKGLAPEDGEEKIRAGLFGIASCLVDAAVDLAESGSVPVEDVLDAIEQSVEELNTSAEDQGLTRGLIDEDLLTQTAAPCLFDVAQELGVAFD